MAYTPPCLHAVTRKGNRLIRKVARRIYSPPYQHFIHSKKVSLFTKKTCKKLAYIKNTYYLCKRKITTTLLTRSLNLLYIYIGKIKSPQLAATGCGRREGKTLHLLTLSGANLAILFGPCKFGGGFLRIKLFSHKYKYLII